MDGKHADHPRPTEGTSTPPSAAVCACHGCYFGGTASLIRLAITGRRAELADKERQQAAIAHLHNKAERYPGQRAAYPIAICTSCSARWIQDGHQRRAINQVQEPSLMALGPSLTATSSTSSTLTALTR